MATRDYKKHAAEVSKPVKSHKGFLLGTTFGLLLGLSIAAGVYLYYQSVLYTYRIPQVATPSVAPEPSPAASEDDRLPGSDYGFFDELPNFEVMIPSDDESKSDPDASRSAPDPMYILQAGAFGKTEEADQRKQSLAKMGYRPKVRKAKSGETYLYRVWLGPYPMRKADAIKRVLKSRGVETLISEYRSP